MVADWHTGSDFCFAFLYRYMYEYGTRMKYMYGGTGVAEQRSIYNSPPIGGATGIANSPPEIEPRTSSKACLCRFRSSAELSAGKNSVLAAEKLVQYRI